MTDTTADSTEDSGSPNSLRKLLKKLLKLYGRLLSYIVILHHNFRMWPRLKVSMLGPPGAGKSSALEALAETKGYLNLSQGLQNVRSGNSGQANQEPHHHPAISEQAEYLVSNNTVIYSHAGERLLCPKNSRRVDYLDYKAIYKQHKGRSDRLLILLINPLLLPEFAQQALYLKLHELQALNGGEASMLTLIEDASEVLFECQRTEFTKTVAKALGNDDNVASDQYFYGCKVDLDAVGLKGGDNAELGTYLINAFIKRVTARSAPYVEAVKFLSRLPNAIMVLSHLDQANSVSNDDLQQALQNLDASDRSANDRILLSSKQYSRPQPGAKRLPIQYSTDSNWAGIRLLAERIDSHEVRGRFRRRGRVAFTVGLYACLALVIGLLT